MNNEDCYFWTDEKLPEENRVVNVMCKDCHQKTPKGWFWEGSKHGYGPYDFICSECGCVIFAPAKNICTKN